MLLFIKRLLFNILLFVLIETPLQIIGLLALLVYLPIQRRIYPVCTKLPFLLRWFDNADLYIGRDTSTYERIYAGDFWVHWHWLTIRNPINYFGYLYQGFQFDGSESYQIEGSLDVGDTPGKHAGYKKIELSNGAYEYLYIKKVSEKSCLYARLGFKIDNMRNRKGSWCQKVFTLSYRSYSGV